MKKTLLILLIPLAIGCSSVKNTIQPQEPIESSSVALEDSVDGLTSDSLEAVEMPEEVILGSKQSRLDDKRHKREVKADVKKEKEKTKRNKQDRKAETKQHKQDKIAESKNHKQDKKAEASIETTKEKEETKRTKSDNKSDVKKTKSDNKTDVKKTKSNNRWGFWYLLIGFILGSLTTFFVMRLIYNSSKKDK